jgi:hypothetical protein
MCNEKEILENGGREKRKLGKFVQEISRFQVEF